MSAGIEWGANVIGIIAFGAKFTKFCFEFSQEVHGLSEHVLLFRNTLTTLTDTLNQIIELKTDSMTQAEEELIQIVNRGAGFCYHLIKDLEKKIPELQENPKVLKKAKIVLDMRFHDHDIQEKISGIKAYSDSIQLSLTALTIKKIIKFDRNMNQLGDLIRQMNTQPFPFQLAEHPPTGLGINSPGYYAQSYDTTRRKLSRDSSLHPQSWDSSSSSQSLSDRWSLKIKEVTRQATPSITPGESRALSPRSIRSPVETASRRSSSISSVFSGTETESFEPIDDVTEGITKEMLDISNKEVIRLAEQGCFLKAARQQDQSIRWRRTLHSSLHLNFDEEANMIERKAELLLRCSTTGRWNEAMKILRDLLRRVEGRWDSEQNHARIGRLHLRVAYLFSQPNRITQRNHREMADFHSEQAFRYLASEQLLELPPELPHAANLRTAILREKGPAGNIQAQGVESYLGIRMVRAGSADGINPPTESPRPDNESISGGSSCSGDTPAVSETAALEWCAKNLKNCDSYSETFKFEEKLASDEVPLYCAIRANEVAVVQQMCAEADLGSEEAGQALILAAETRSKAMAKVLLQHGAPIDQRDAEGGTVLHACQRKEDTKHGAGIARLFLKHREESSKEFIDRRDDKGRTALFLAYEIGHQNMVTTLLKYKADPEIRDSTRKSCLHLAVEIQTPTAVVMTGAATRRPSVQSNATLPNGQNKRVDMLRELLETGLDPNVVDNYDETPLHRACVLGYRDAVELLVKAGADVNGRTLDGETPLIAAARRHQAGIARVLMREGAQPRLKDRNGNDAFYYASGPVGHRVLQALQGHY